MPLKQSVLRTQPMQLEVAFLPIAFRHGCLAASPRAVLVNDPFVCGAKEDTRRKAVQFLFNDIPDCHFREPAAAIAMSDFPGGRKS